MTEEKEKINYLVELSLKQFKLPFTYTRVTVDCSDYYGEKDYHIELLFHNFNGDKYPHRNCIRCVDGDFSQIMYQDRGYPTASLSFDRELLPKKAVRSLIKAAYFDSKLCNREEDIKKANI